MLLQIVHGFQHKPLKYPIRTSFFDTLKVEGTFGKPFKSTSEASLYIFECTEIFYNRTGMHSGFNYFNPAEFEQLSVNEEVRNCA